jgi:hypothetical protein
LAALSLSAVDPDWFLAVTLTGRVYAATLEDICSARTRDPRTPEDLHAALARAHPNLFEAMRHVFPRVEPSPSDHRPATDLFRGVRCMVCAGLSGEALEAAGGVCAECRKPPRSMNPQDFPAAAALEGPSSPQLPGRRDGTRG